MSLNQFKNVTTGEMNNNPLEKLWMLQKVKLSTTRTLLTAHKM